MAKERLQFRADKDTVAALEDYIDDEGTASDTRSEAVRKFLRAGLADEGYPIAATDGGGSYVARLERLEQRQERIGLLNMAALSIGIIYITATLQYGLSNLLWAGIGVIVLVPLLLASYRYQSEGSA